jgi:hypothetical protein
MRNPRKPLMVALGVAMAFWPAGAKSLNAQVKGKPTLGQELGENGTGGPAPYHNLEGTWIEGPGEANLATEVPPMTPEGLAEYKQNIPDPYKLHSNDPWRTCDTFGMPRIVNNEDRTIGFATMPDRIILLENYNKVWREVWMDGRALPKDPGHRDSKDSSRWYGYSVGHWEGPDTLVVETNGMMPESWVDRRGLPHSVDAKVIERYTRIDHNHLKMTETIVDPAYYTKPFVDAIDTYKWVADEANPQAGPIPPYADEQMCIPSQMIEYMKALAAPAQEGDAATGK